MPSWHRSLTGGVVAYVATAKNKHGRFRGNVYKKYDGAWRWDVIYNRGAWGNGNVYRDGTASDAEDGKRQANAIYDGEFSNDA